MDILIENFKIKDNLEEKSISRAHMKRQNATRSKRLLIEPNHSLVTCTMSSETQPWNSGFLTTYQPTRHQYHARNGQQRDAGNRASRQMPFLKPYQGHPCAQPQCAPTRNFHQRRRTFTSNLTPLAKQEHQPRRAPQIQTTTYPKQILKEAMLSILVTDSGSSTCHT